MSTTESTGAATAELPDDGITSQEIVQRASITEHAVQVMPLLSDAAIRSTWRTAKALAASRMFKDAYQAEQAFAKILIGRDLGISPTQSLMSIDLVKGSIQLRGVLLASFVRKHPDYDYKVLEKTHTKSRVLFLGYPQDEQDEGLIRNGGRWWEVLGEEEFTIEDAERARLVKTDSAWAAHPKNMCFWRCISNGVKTHCPELLGGMPVYVEGELDGASPAYGQAAPSQSQADPADLPEAIAQLVARASAIDPRTWRHAEVAARLPEENTEGYQAALDRLVTELTEWLAEHDPPEAEVVSDAEPVGDAAPAEEPAQPAGDGNEVVDVAADLQQRWETDQEWREQVDPVMHRYADLEASLDTAVAEDDGSSAAQLREELEKVEGEMDALGVPAGWFPENRGTQA